MRENAGRGTTIANFTEKSNLLISLRSAHIRSEKVNKVAFVHFSFTFDFHDL